MRSRLLVSTLAAVMVAVILLGVPFLVGVRYIVEQQALDDLQRSVEQFPQAVGDLRSDPAGANERIREVFRDIAGTGRRYVFYIPTEQGLRPVADTNPERPLAGFDADLRGALASGEVRRTHRDGVLAVTVPFQTGGGTVLFRGLQDDEEVRYRTHRLRMAIGSLAAVSLAAATLAAMWQGKRFAVPIQDLAASARRLGDGDFSARAPRSGLPEPDEVASALDSTATRLAAMLERSRSFNADASHQLRTPLTALRLDLEALEQTGAAPELVAAAIAEADRLEATIDELLALAEAPRGEEEIDVGALAGERLAAWQSLARAQGREVMLRAAPVPPVRARAAALGQSLQVLLDNALEHGQGTITVSVGEIAGGVRLCVADEGPGIAPGMEDSLFAGGARANGDGHGRGLPLARSLVEAEGGRISVERARPGAVICLLLPAAPRPPAPGEQWQTAPAASRSRPPFPLEDGPG